MRAGRSIAQDRINPGCEKWQSRAVSRNAQSALNLKILNQDLLSPVPVARVDRLIAVQRKFETLQNLTDMQIDHRGGIDSACVRWRATPASPLDRASALMI